MRYLVTGGAGFIGSHLCEALLSAGHHVICLDNLLTGQKKNIEHLTGDFKFIMGSACNGNEFSVDGIFHLASPTAPEDSRNNESETIKVNCLGTLKMLDMARGEKVLFASSMKVLGDCPRVTAYIIGKRLGENLCAGAGAKIARLGSVYGPRMRYDDSRVIPTFIRKATVGEPLSVWNGGHQIDSFCFVDDIVSGLISFMESDEVGLMEFGNPNGISILDLACHVIALAGSRSPIRTDEEVVVAEECHKVPDISRAKKVLGWEPSVGLDLGLSKTIRSTE